MAPSNAGMEFRYDAETEQSVYNLHVDELTDAAGKPVALPPGSRTVGFTIDSVVSDELVAGLTLKS